MIYKTVSTFLVKEEPRFLQYAQYCTVGRWPRGTEGPMGWTGPNFTLSHLHGRKGNLIKEYFYPLVSGTFERLVFIVELGLRFEVLFLLLTTVFSKHSAWLGECGETGHAWR